MSNVDTLLDLGDASAPPQDTNQTNPPNLLDPFDQLAPSTESLSPQKTPEQTDLLGSFDPFSSTTMSSATNGDAAIDASLSTDQVKTMEQEFDDLLGGFSSTTPTETVTNGTTDEPVVHLDEDLGESSTTDDIVTVTQKTTSVDGETVITETRTETLSDGRTLIETSSVTEKETESAIDSNGLENGALHATSSSSSNPSSHESFVSKVVWRPGKPAEDKTTAQPPWSSSDSINNSAENTEPPEIEYQEADLAEDIEVSPQSESQSEQEGPVFYNPTLDRRDSHEKVVPHSEEEVYIRAQDNQTEISEETLDQAQESLELESETESEEVDPIIIEEQMAAVESLDSCWVAFKLPSQIKQLQEMHKAKKPTLPVEMPQRKQEPKIWKYRLKQEQAEAEKKMSTSSDKELRLSSTSESTPEVKSLEESLPDYQPPKRNVKKEERKPSRGPSTFIADSASTNGPETPKLSKVTQSDTTAEYDIKPSTPFKSLLASFGTPKGGGSENQCKACGKRVYEMEKMIADKAIYHKMCFKCAKCNRICSLGNFAAMDGQIFCKPHFISMFKTKGNYDEGFGREKHTKQWANRNSSPATFQAQSAAQDAQEEPAANADSRINYEDEDTPNGDDSRDSDIIRETPEKEPIHFEQLSSVRSHFESLSKTPQEQTFTPKSSRASKWDKPKSQTPAPVVNRFDEDGEEEEEADGQGYKPVRRITPPRDHVEGYSPATGDESDEEVQRDPNIVRGSEGEVRAEELPPPAVTKNLLAKFRSMEDINQDAHSPARTPGVKKSASMRSPPRHEVVEIRQETYETRSSEPEVVNGHDSSDAGDSPTGVTKESDTNVEAELPERGYTRNLVAQWRSREELFGGTPEPVTKTKSAKQTPSSVSRKTAPVSYSQPQHDEPVYQNVETANHDSLPNGEGTGDHSGRGVIRSDDTPNIEDELPPRAMARNMRSMFENMAVESEREKEATTPKSNRKQFKFSVKETGFHVKTPNREDIDHEIVSADTPIEQLEELQYSYEDEPFEEESPVDESENVPSEMHEEELPPAEYTRSMLAKFRSMEDVNRPPPTPEVSEKQSKSMGSVHRTGNPNVRLLSQSSQDASMSSPVEREQPDGGEYHQGQYDTSDFEGEGGEYENVPVENQNVVRESDLLDEDAYPEQGTTRNLLAKFQTLEAH